jgi:hypothetical protein
MNEHEHLEQELASFRPPDPSPELKFRIAAEIPQIIEREARYRPKRFVSALAIAGGVLAVVIAMVWRSGETVPLSNTQPEFFEPSLATAMDQELPTVWSYRGVLDESPDRLHELLDKHANRGVQTEMSSAPDRIFARLDRASETLTGEL